MHDADLILLVCAGLTVVSVLTSVIAFRVGAPLLLIFLVIGLLAGENGPGGIIFDNAPATYLICSAALAIVLFDGGFHTRLSSYRHAAAPAILLATVGVGLTVAIVAVAAHLLLHIPWLQSLLLGTALSSTDAAALFFLLRVGGITLRDRVRSTLEIESGTNDPFAIFLTLTLVAIASGDAEGNWLTLLARFAWQAGGGVAFGIAGGFAIVTIVNRLRIDAGLVPVVVMAWSVALFALTNEAGASGFLATYLAGLVAGNARLPAVGALRRFQDGITWFAQIAMFITLGLLATPRDFPAILGAALALAGLLIFVARPVAVLLCLLPFRFSGRERVFIGWVGLRGAVSILLTLVPVLAGVPDAADLFDIAFVVVMASLIVQGWSVRPLARTLRLIVPARSAPVDRMEIDLPGLAGHEIVMYRLPPNSPLAEEGRELPRWARPVLVRRGEQEVTAPRQFMAGDQVYFLATPPQVPLLDKLLSVQDSGDAEATLYGDFTMGPDVTLKALRETYGLTPTGAEEGLSLGELFEREFAHDLELGDRVHLGTVDLIVREIEEGRVRSVGIALEPPPERSVWRSLRARFLAPR